MRWILLVQAGCDLEPMKGQCSSTEGSPGSHKPDMHLHRHVQTHSLGVGGTCLSEAPFCAGRLWAVPLLQANEGGWGQRGAMPLELPSPLASAS